MAADERGQATAEWIGVVLVVALALGALLAAGPRVDGRSFGGFLAHRIGCAVKGGCSRMDEPLLLAYGSSDAELVRRYAPNIVYEPGTLTLPVDFRQCREHRCSDARDHRDLDVHRSLRGGTHATAFTHVVRDGGETFIQYWFYYPDSTSTVGNTAAGYRLVTGKEYPGWHADDWESYQVRIDQSGRVWVRASSHHGYQGCKQAECENSWFPWTGWTRVSWGSHAGHIPTRAPGDGAPQWPPLRDNRRDAPAYPGVDLRERTTTAEGLVLVPLESMDRRGYERKDPGISPPWDKDVWRDPRSDATD
jgi:hypothetical protein